MSDSRSLTRMPVYDVSNGRVIGRVHRLIVDPDARKVAGLVLATRLGREARCLPFRSIHAVGEHAVTVRGTEAVVRLSELPDMEEMFRTRRRIYHSPVLTEDGTFIGDVDEFTVNAQTGRIEALLVSGGMVQDMFRRPMALPAHLVLTIGEDATIVRDQTVAMLNQRHERSGDARRRRYKATDGADDAHTADGNDTESTPPDDAAEGGWSRRRPADRRLPWTVRWSRWLRRSPEVLDEPQLAAPDNAEDQAPPDEARKPSSGRDFAEARQPTRSLDDSGFDPTAGPNDRSRAAGPNDRSGAAGPGDGSGTRPSPSVVQFGYEAGFQKHRAQNADDVGPTVAADRGEGGDGKA